MKKPTQEVNRMKPIIGIILVAVICAAFVFVMIRNHRKK